MKNLLEKVINKKEDKFILLDNNNKWKLLVNEVIFKPIKMEGYE